MPMVAVAVATAVGLALLASSMVRVGADVYPEPGSTKSTAVTTPLASIVAVAVAIWPFGCCGRENLTIGWFGYPEPPLVSVMLSTPPLAVAAAGVVGAGGAGKPPVMVTAGAVKPKPVSSTAMLVMTPLASTAVAAASAVGVSPGEVIATVGTEVYPDPGEVMMIEVTAPVFGATVAVASAPVPPPPLMVTTASVSVCGLLAQFGYGPK